MINREHLKELYSYDDEEWKSITKKEMSLPYDVVPIGSRIVLYGAGKNGKKIYETIKKDNKWSIVAWVDSNYKQLWDDIQSPEILKTGGGRI